MVWVSYHDPLAPCLEGPPLRQAHDESVHELFQQGLVGHEAPEVWERLEECCEAWGVHDPLARSPARAQEYHERPARHQVRGHAFRDGLEV